MTYYMFGDAVQDIATKNIGYDLEMKPFPTAKGFGAFSLVWLLFKLQGSQVPISNPFVEIISKMLNVKLPWSNRGMACFLLSFPVILALAGGSHVLQNQLALLKSICGSTVMNINAIIFPPLAYLRVCKPEGFIARLGAVTMIVLGIIFIFIGNLH